MSRKTEESTKGETMATNNNEEELNPTKKTKNEQKEDGLTHN